MARSPSPRRRSKGPGTPSQVTADLALGSRRRRTPSPAKARGRGRSPKTPDDSAVIPFLSTTPTPPPAAAKKSPAKGPSSATKNISGNEMAAAAQTKSRRARRSATISPRTRGTAIASILASPGDLPLAHGAAGIANRFVSPSQRSAAEAALNRLARGAKTAAGVGAKKAQGRRKRGTSLDSLLAGSAGVLGMGTGTTPTVPGKRRRRKAASDASAKVHAMSAKDELDRPPGSADKIFYKKAPVGRRKKGDVQPAPSSSDNGGAAAGEESAHKSATASGAGGFMPKNKVDERWLRNFQKWTASQNHTNDDNAAALVGLSPLPKKWARDQRAHYRRWMKEEKTNMTREKVALLEAAGFEWEGKSGRPGHKKAEKGGGEEKRGRSGKGAGKARVDVSPSARKFGSPERKSPRRSPPTQFYHNLGAASSDVGNVDTGKTASTQDGTKSSSEPTPGTPTESPSKRKSPRKSPPTQFYHNLGAASSEDGKANTARKSLLPKLNAATTPVTNGSEDSGPGSKKGRPVSPSKRMSVNSESLASVGAKSKSDGKGKKKKRRFRGSGGSASLSALGPMQFGELKQPSAKKAKGSLSYEELEAELKKKGKKKPVAKKEGETAKKKQSAKKAKAKMTKDGGGTAATAQAPSGAKESEEVAASHFSSVANEAGPLSSPPSSPPAANASASSAANDASTEKEAVPEAVCVTKLLLSCLSEDSAEMAQPSGSISNDVPQNTAEQDAEEPGQPAATSSPTKDVLAEQPSQPQKESASSPAVKKKRGRPRKHPLPSQPQKESVPVPKDPLAEEERPRSWTCDVCNEATFADYDVAAAHERECAKAKEAKGAPVEQREEAANEEAVDSWTCDVCRKATFGEYDEAVAHERVCRGKQSRARKQSSSLAGGSEADSQPTPPQHRAPVDDTALAQFSPLSLTSPLQANNLMDSRYSSNGRGAPFPPSHIGGTQFHPVTAVVPNQTMNLVQNVNLNVSLPPGMLPTSEGHAQMILAERQYQEKMAEFGRLELEAKMVTDRMREIEERIEGIDSHAIAADVDAGRQIEETVSRKRSYRETHHYESSEGDEYRSPRKRRRRKRASEETITMKRVKVRSSSSRRGDQLSSQSSYDNEHIVLKSSSRSPKKADRRRAYDSPDEYEDLAARSTSGSRKKSKAKRPAQVGRKSPSRLRKASPKRRQKSSLEVSGEVEKSPHMPTTNGPREEIDDEGSAPHEGDASKQPPEEKELGKASASLPGEDRVDQKEEAASSNAKAKDGKDESGPSQPAQARDPLYWLAGGENSSDDESWDFDGPMILPPPPIG
ncbi:hypothetical protein ACHAXT_010394 [Thalassiosira profunda]